MKARHWNLVITITLMVAAAPAYAQSPNEVVTIGVLTDLSGPASDATGQGSVMAAEMAVEDFGKTVGLIALLNNLTQPLAGLLVGLCATRLGAGPVILALTLCMALIGIALVALVAVGGRRAAWMANIEEA